jgi:hypothetical protein
VYKVQTRSNTTQGERVTTRFSVSESEGRKIEKRVVIGGGCDRRNTFSSFLNLTALSFRVRLFRFVLRILPGKERENRFRSEKNLTAAAKENGGGGKSVSQ